MARRVILTCLAALLAICLPAASARADASVAQEIVVMRAGGLTQVELARAGVRAERDLPLDGVEVVRARDGRAAALSALRADPDVAWAEPNQLRHATADPLAGLLGQPAHPASPGRAVNFTSLVVVSRSATNHARQPER